MLLSAIFVVFANIFFLYFFWRRLKEDYVSEQIFTTAFFALLFMLVTYVVTIRYLTDWWFWTGFAAGLGGISIGIFRFKFRVVETIEAFLLACLPVLMIICFGEYVRTGSVINIVASLVMAVFLLMFFLVDKHYKRFSWYRSGRIGFSGLSLAGGFFLLRAIVASYFDNMLSFSGKYEVYTSAVVAFFAFLGAFTLARKET
jgi:hypothetical protein